MEIVSKPDMRSAEEAKAYVTKLRTILRYLGTCDGNMEEGSLRADVNVSVRKPGRAARHALRDQERQLDPLHRPGDRVRGAPPDRHSRGRRHDRSGDAAVRSGKGETRSMRSKEEAHDYRYFPDPDLLPLEFDQAYVDALARQLPELPDEKKARFIARLWRSRPMTPACWSRSAPRPTISRQVAKGRDAKLAANWVINELFGRAQQGGQGHRPTSPVSAAQLGAIVDLISTQRDLRQDRQGPVRDRAGPRAATRRRSSRARGMKQVTDTGAIEKAVDEIIAANPDKVEQAQGQADHARLVRRPGDEGDRRQGQSAGGERASESETRHLSCAWFCVSKRQFCERVAFFAARFLFQQIFFSSRNFVRGVFGRTRVVSKRAKFIAKNECARVAPQAKTTPARGREKLPATKAERHNKILFYIDIT